MFRKRDYTVTRTDPGKRILMDVIAHPRPPDGHALLWVDMSAAREFCHQYRRKYKVPLTDLHLMIKASAIMIKHYPSANRMLDGYKIITPDSIDIGVSVAGEEGITPVVVVRNADQKPLPEIVEEFKEKKKKAIEEEQENLEKLRKIGRWIPINFIRRQLVQFLTQKHFVKRNVIGTFQITSLNMEDVEVHTTNHLGTAMNLSTGAVVKRPVVIDDKIEIRPVLYTCWQADTRVIPARDVIKSAQLFKWLMEHPAEIDDK